MKDSSPLLMDLAFAALDHGTKTVVDSGGPLTPFSFSNSKDTKGVSLARYDAGPLEASVEAMRVTVAGVAGLVRVALVWDGYLTADGVRSDAVFVEAYEAGCDRSVILAQRYGVGRRRRVTLYGRPAQVGHGDPLF